MNQRKSHQYRYSKMSEITVNLNPCTNEDNDGSKIPIEDEVKFMIYNNLLSIYTSNKKIALEAYNGLKKKIKDFR